MALVNFGKKEIENLEEQVTTLSKKVYELESENSRLTEYYKGLLRDKDMEFISYQNPVFELREEREVLRKENAILKRIVIVSKSKATGENIEIITRLKEEGKSYREIASVLTEETGEAFAHSTVSYLYHKYIE